MGRRASYDTLGLLHLIQDSNWPYLVFFGVQFWSNAANQDYHTISLKDSLQSWEEWGAPQHVIGLNRRMEKRGHIESLYSQEKSSTTIKLHSVGSSFRGKRSSLKAHFPTFRCAGPIVGRTVRYSQGSLQWSIHIVNYRRRGVQESVECTTPPSLLFLAIKSSIYCDN